MEPPGYILDFDGTLTDIEKETEFFQKNYPIIFFQRLGMNPEEKIKEFEEIKQDLIKSSKGFILGGFDVLPISADPYIWVQGASQEFLRKHNHQLEDETKFMIDLYSETISKKPKEAIPFREGNERTKKFLNRLLDSGKVAIVTNSKAEKINNGLNELGERYAKEIIVCGDAKKLFIDKDFSEIHYSIKVLGSNREALLRRKNYFKILKNLQNQGFLPSKTEVIGNIYELDLSLPHYLGYGVIQIENGYSKEYERIFLQERFVKNYDELEKLIFK